MVKIYNWIWDIQLYSHTISRSHNCFQRIPVYSICCRCHGVFQGLSACMWQNGLLIIIRWDNLHNTCCFDFQFQISHEILNRFCLRSLVAPYLLHIFLRFVLLVILFRSTVRLHVSLHITSYSERLSAHPARMRLLAGVYATMIL